MSHCHHDHEACCHEGHHHEDHCHEGHCHDHSEHSCCSHEHGNECHHHERYADVLLDLADEAWMEVLKEKIKEEIRHASGDHLNELAKLVSSSNHARWKDKLQQKQDVCEFEGRLHELLSRPSPKKTKK
ncbi:MAG: hypothetical protein WCF65_08895 [Parachlamydiaceae bacterium]